MLVLHTVAMKHLMLRLQLMIDLALELFCKFQISTYTIAKSDLDEALIIQGLDVRIMSLNI